MLRLHGVDDELPNSLGFLFSFKLSHGLTEEYAFGRTRLSYLKLLMDELTPHQVRKSGAVSFVLLEHLLDDDGQCLPQRVLNLLPPIEPDSSQNLDDGQSHRVDIVLKGV